MDRCLQLASVNAHRDICSLERTIRMNSVASFVQTIVKNVRTSLTSVQLVKVSIKFYFKTNASKSVQLTIILILWLSNAFLVLSDANFVWTLHFAWNVHRTTLWMIKMYVRQNVHRISMDRMEFAKNVHFLARVVLVNQAVCPVSRGFIIKPNALINALKVHITAASMGSNNV